MGEAGHRLIPVRQQLGTRRLWDEGAGEAPGLRKRRGGQKRNRVGHRERRSSRMEGGKLVVKFGGRVRRVLRTWEAPAATWLHLPRPGDDDPRQGAGQQGLTAVPAPSAPCCPRLPLAATPGTRLARPISAEKRGLETFSPKARARRLQATVVSGGRGRVRCGLLARKTGVERACRRLRARGATHPHASPSHWWPLSALALAQEETKVQLVEESRALGVPGIGLHLKAPYPSPEMLESTETKLA